MATFLEAISAGDLGFSVENEDWVAVTSSRERLGQEVTYRTTYGSDAPNVRTKRKADANTISFSFILLKSGVQKGLNNPAFLQGLEDFTCHIRRGSVTKAYPGCNWTDIDIDEGVDGVTVNVDISVPGF
jgi:hypothetical protein